MSESFENASRQRAESERERHEREAERFVAEEYRALLARADERVRVEPMFWRVEMHGVM